MKIQQRKVLHLAAGAIALSNDLCGPIPRRADGAPPAWLLAQQ
jgi:hypothetical protein